MKAINQSLISSAAFVPSLLSSNSYPINRIYIPKYLHQIYPENLTIKTIKLLRNKQTSAIFRYRSIIIIMRYEKI